jgi:hemoglobin
VIVVCAALGCSSDSNTKKADTVYERLGEAAGIDTLVGDFLNRVYVDSRVSGYFLNNTIDQKNLRSCFVKQIANATGGPETYDCRSMKDVHAGLHVSKQDFEDLVSDFSDALVAANVSQADIDTVLGVLGPMADDIVEDATNDGTLYQQLGRKPNIALVIDGFIGRVAADPSINGFFADTNIPRIEQCLVRQVCGATGGPCVYGKEIYAVELVSDEPDISLYCRSMSETHRGLGIAYADFGALVGHLGAELEADGVPADAQAAIVSVLGPLCPDIVTKGKCE